MLPERLPGIKNITVSPLASPAGELRDDQKIANLFAGTDKLRGMATIKRYCHGQVKVTLSPDVGGNKKPAQKRSQEPVWKSLPEQAREAKQFENFKQMWQGILTPERLLVRSKKFQGSIEETSGFGGLPPRKIFRPYAAIAIQECSFVSQELYGLNGLFMTGTIPGTGDEIAETVARYSGYLWHLVRQFIQDICKIDYSRIAVWELQKRGMLHLHVVVSTCDTAALQVIQQRWQGYWRKLLEDLSDSTGVDLFRKNEDWSWRGKDLDHLADCGLLRKSPARYLAKYLSKNARGLGTSSHFHPSRWWSVDAATHAKAIAMRIKEQIKGWTIGELRGWLVQVEGFAKALTDSVRHFSNPDWWQLPGINCYFEDGKDWDFMMLACSITSRA